MMTFTLPQLLFFIQRAIFCEMNIVLVYQDLGLQLFWGQLHLHSRGYSLVPLIFHWKERCLLSLSLPASSKDSLRTSQSFLKAQNTLDPGKLSNKWTCLGLVKRWLEFVCLVPPAGPWGIVCGCKTTHCLHSHLGDVDIYRSLKVHSCLSFHR